MEWEPDPRILNFVFVLIAGFVHGSYYSGSNGRQTFRNVWTYEPAVKCLYDHFYRRVKFPVDPNRRSKAL